MKRMKGRPKLEFFMVLPEEKKYSFRWVFGSSHMIMGLFSALGVFVVPLYASNFFTPKILAFLYFYLIIHLVLALDYYYDRNIDEKFLFFFYIFSLISFLIFFVFYFFNF